MTTVNYQTAKTATNPRLAKSVKKARKQSVRRGVDFTKIGFAVESKEAYMIPSNEYLAACGVSAFQSFTSKTVNNGN